MINKLIEMAMRNKFLVVLFFTAVAAAGYWAMMTTPIDAIPDLSENQVIVFTDWLGRSPEEVENQITFPLVSNLQGLAGVKVVRSQSMFGFSIIYIIFNDNIDLYWARTRVLEKLNLIAGSGLPPGVVPILGPDATGVGQVFWYTLENGYYCQDKQHQNMVYEEPGNCPIDGSALVQSKLNPAELRSLQDWFIRYQLNSVTGVAEVGSIGGFVRQYQIDIDPNALHQHKIPLSSVMDAVMKSNNSVGAKVVEDAGAGLEYIVRGVGWIKGIEDIENIAVGSSSGTPIYVKNIATVQLGPEFRRGVLEKDGEDAVGGVIVARYGVNTNEVIKNVKAKIEEIRAGLPAGVRLVSFYDRSLLVGRAVNTLKDALIEEIILVTLAHIIFLMHFRSILIVTLPLPLAILISFLFMRIFGISSNIMSLGGIAIAVGVLVDAGIVVTENAFRNLEREGVDPSKDKKRAWEVILGACKLVGRPIFFSMTIIIIAFIPVFSLIGQEGKLFHPLAFAKTFAMIGATIIAVTLVPVFCVIFIKGKLHSEEENIVMKAARFFYEPLLRFGLTHKKITITSALSLFLIGLCLAFGAGKVLLAPFRLPVELATVITGKEILPGYYDAVSSATNLLNTKITKGLGREFMPPLDEGDLLFMPITAPNVSLTAAVEIMKYQDGKMREFPEVLQVVGKSGRAETSTDPAPVSMFETVVNLRPYNEWPKRAIREDVCNNIFEDIFEHFTKSGNLKFLKDVAKTRWDGFMERLAEERQKIEAENISPDEKSQKIRAFEKRSREEIATFESDLDNIMVKLAKQFTRNATLSIDRFTRNKVGDKKTYNIMLESLPAELEKVSISVFEKLVEEGDFSDFIINKPTESETRDIISSIVKQLGKKDLLVQYTKERLRDDVMDTEVRYPGVGNIWTQPIINRIDMLSTGIRTQVGIKVYGSGKNNLEVLANIEKKAQEIAEVVKQIPGAVDVFVEPINGASYIEITPKPTEIARYGLTKQDIFDVIEVALGGKNITTTIEGRERYPVRIRYARAHREDIEAIRKIYVDTPNGAKIPLVQLADIKVTIGPAAISSEKTLLRGIVYLNCRGRDVGSFVDEAKEIVARKVQFPAGYFIEWSGQYENQIRARNTLFIVFPICLLVILVLLYFTYHSWKEAAHVIMAIPFALTGGFIFQAIMGYNFSVAVWVGYIALFGTAAETGIVMVIYLEEALQKRIDSGVPLTPEIIREAAMEGALLRLRPKLMTVGTTLAGLIPIMWAVGAGSEVMRPLATPIIGGMFSSLLHVLVVTPVIFTWLRERELKKGVLK